MQPFSEWLMEAKSATVNTTADKVSITQVGSKLQFSVKGIARDSGITNSYDEEFAGFDAESPAMNNSMPWWLMRVIKAATDKTAPITTPEHWGMSMVKSFRYSGKGTTKSGGVSFEPTSSSVVMRSGEGNAQFNLVDVDLLSGAFEIQISPAKSPDLKEKYKSMRVKGTIGKPFLSKAVLDMIDRINKDGYSDSMEQELEKLARAGRVTETSSAKISAKLGYR